MVTKSERQRGGVEIGREREREGESVSNQRDGYRRENEIGRKIIEKERETSREGWTETVRDSIKRKEKRNIFYRDKRKV